MRWAIIGTGALGGLYGARLQEAGEEVHFLLRSDYAHVRAHGLQVDSIWGDMHLRSGNWYDGTRAMPTVDVACVCWKTTANAQLAETLRPLLRPDTLILLLQNGIGAEEEVAAAFPGQPVAGGLAFLCSNRIAPGHIHHLDQGRIMLGAHACPAERLQAVCERFSAAGVPVSQAESLSAARWRKLVWNIPYNGLCAILQQDTSRIMACAATRDLVAALMQEVHSAAAATGNILPADLPEQMLRTTDAMPPYRPSMQLDRENGRPLEVVYLYDRPLALAHAASCAMPRTATLAAQLHALEQ
ncbi:MAG: putative 2-dehydropantoate 2-reductase [Planctomycetota bacterium]